MTSVAPLIVNNVSCVTRIHHESYFSAPGAAFAVVGG